MMFKRNVIVLAMLVAIGVFFAGLTIARADSGDDGSDDPTPTCTLPGNDEGDQNDQGEDVQGDDQGEDVQGTDANDELDGNGGDDQIDAGDGNDDVCGDQ